MVEETFGQLLV